MAFWANRRLAPDATLGGGHALNRLGFRVNKIQSGRLGIQSDLSREGAELTQRHLTGRASMDGKAHVDRRVTPGQERGDTSTRKPKPMTRPKKKSARSAGSMDQDIGAAIRSARQTRGVSQQDLAARIGVTFQQLQKYESASNRVSASRLVDIAGALDVAITDFLPSIGARSGPNVSAPELAKLIGLYLRLDHADQKRVLDYAARLDGGA